MRSDGRHSIVMMTGVRQLILCLVMVTVFNPLVKAEEIDKGDTVLNRARPELRALGISMGSFLVFPEFGITAAVNDNVFASNEGEKDDFVAIFSPGLSVKSNWNNHALKLAAHTDIARYQDFDSEDYRDYEISGDGQYNVSRDIDLEAGLTFGRYHQPRYSEDDFFGTKPTIYNRDDIFARYRHKRGRYHFTAGINLAREDYHDVRGLTGSTLTTIDQDFLDFDERVIELQGGYEYLSDSSLYLKLKESDRDYDYSQAGFELERSSGDYQILLGADFTSYELITGEVFVGVSEHNYSQPQDDIKNSVLGVDLDWNITRLTTIGFNLDQFFFSSNSRAFVGYESISVMITLDHELLRNLTLNAGITWVENSYTGIEEASREDSLFELRTGVTYPVNRHFSINGEYIHQQRDSMDNTIPADSSRDVTRNILYIQLQTQY